MKKHLEGLLIDFLNPVNFISGMLGILLCAGIVIGVLSCSRDNSPEGTIDARYCDTKNISRYTRLDLLEITVMEPDGHKETHQYVIFGNGMAHWEGCKYCREKHEREMEQHNDGCGSLY